MTSAWSAAPAPVERILKVVRFGIVGIAATATYLAVAILLPAIGAATEPPWVSFFGASTTTTSTTTSAGKEWLLEISVAAGEVALRSRI